MEINKNRKQLELINVTEAETLSINYDMIFVKTL